MEAYVGFAGGFFCFVLSYPVLPVLAGCPVFAEFKPRDLGVGDGELFVRVSRVKFHRRVCERATGAAVENMLFDLNREKGITLVIVTHDPDLAQRCKRIVEMKDGKIIAEHIGEASE